VLTDGLAVQVDTWVRTRGDAPGVHVRQDNLPGLP
jgi:hypothetical protein